MRSLFLESWITKYEMLHQVTKPIQSNDPFVIRKPNGKVEIRFLTASPEKKDVTVFPIQIAMLQPVSYVCENGLKIKAFEKMESLVMKVNHLLVTYGGIFVIVLIAEKKFLKKIIQEERKKSFQQILKERYEAGDPEVDLLGELSGKFDYYVLYPRTRKQKIPAPPCKKYHVQNPKPPLIPN